MECDEMNELVDAEGWSRKLCHMAMSDHLQMLYGQWMLDAKRVQSIHFELCETCQKQEVKA